MCFGGVVRSVSEVLCLLEMRVAGRINPPSRGPFSDAGAEKRLGSKTAKRDRCMKGHFDTLDTDAARVANLLTCSGQATLPLQGFFSLAPPGLSLSPGVLNPLHACQALKNSLREKTSMVDFCALVRL